MLCQDVLSHENVVDSIVAKGQRLGSSGVSAKLEQLKTRYLNLCDAAKVGDERSKHNLLL